MRVRKGKGKNIREEGKKKNLKKEGKKKMGGMMIMKGIME